MKFKILFLILVLTTCVSTLFGQTPYVKQILISNSGKFEFAPPYQDFVTIQSNNPVTGTGSIIQTIGTQSSQDMCKWGTNVFIAAQDSLIMMDLDNHQRIKAIADSGLNKLCIAGNYLLVTKQYPVTSVFMEVFNAADLSLVASIGGLPGDCGGVTVAGDSAYVAVNGGWMGTEGKIAVISMNDWMISRIINLGPEAIGILSMYFYNGKIFTVNKSPYSSPDAGSISVYDPSSGTFSNILFDKNVAAGAGTEGNLLYFIYNYGIASFNMNTLQMENPAIVPDPGSSMFRYITSATIDTLNKRIYTNIGDYLSPGTCRISSLTGDSATSWGTGISSDALLVDYRIPGAGVDDPENLKSEVRITPNPAGETVSVSLAKNKDIQELTVSDMTGRILKSLQFGEKRNSVTLATCDLPSGIYLIRLILRNGTSLTGKVLRN